MIHLNDEKRERSKEKNHMMHHAWCGDNIQTNIGMSRDRGEGGLMDPEGYYPTSFEVPSLWLIWTLKT